MSRPATYRGLRVTRELIRRHLAFSSGYLILAQRERAGGADGFADHAMIKRRQHQQSLANIRAQRQGAL